jgi:hypothetical protein
MTSNPSRAPRGVREALSIETLRQRPLPRRSDDEIERMRSLSRGRSASPRLARHAPPCCTVTTRTGE